MKKSMFLPSVLFLLISSTILAQTFAIGPQLGFVKTSDAEKAAMMPGVAVRLNLIGVSVEAAMHYKSETFNTPQGNLTIKTYPISLTAFVNVLPVVHAEAGIGWYTAKIDFDHPFQSISNETKSNPGYHIGAGVTIPAGNLLLTGDFRYVFLNLKSTASFKSDFTALMIGVMFGI